MIFLEKKKQMISVKHSSNIGDLIASLSGLNHWHKENAEKVNYFQQIDVTATYHQAYYHPTQENGKQVMCNKKMFEMLKPLLLYQNYINSFELYVGQETLLDFDKIRQNVFVNMPYTPIQSWYFFLYPDLSCDLSKTWIEVPNKKLYKGIYDNKIVLNFTSRYRNDYIDYFFLKKYESELVFAGTEIEHKEFTEKWGLEIPLIKVNNFLELAIILKRCKFFLGNQSFCWNLVNAMGVPRILELYSYAPNCVPFIGENNYGFYHQNALVYYFKKLVK